MLKQLLVLGLLALSAASQAASPLIYNADRALCLKDKICFQDGSCINASGVLSGPVAQNLVYTGPATGADALPSFRALVNADVLPAATSAATASTVARRDASGNLFSANAMSALTSTASAAGTTTLTAASSRIHQLTGATTQTYKLPVATTLTAGATYEFRNNSTGALSVVDDGSNAVVTVPAGSAALVSALTVASSNGTWDARFLIPANNTVPTTGGGTGLTTYTTGDIPYASATNTLSKRAAGSEGDTLQYQGGVPVTSYFMDPCRGHFLFDPMISNTSGGVSTGIGITGTASGLQRDTPNEDATHVGAYFIQTGTSSATAGSYAGWSTTTHGAHFGSGAMQFDANLRLSRLSTALQEYVVKIGWFDSVASTDATQNGVYWYYDRATYGDFWVMRIANAGVITSTATSIPVTATTWFHPRLVVAAAGTTATFTMDGVSGGAAAGTIPTGAGKSTGSMVGIHKNVGTGTNTELSIDFLFQKMVYATPICN